MPRLTVRQKTRIIAEYVDGDGRVMQAQLAQKYNYYKPSGLLV